MYVHTYFNTETTCGANTIDFLHMLVCPDAEIRCISIVKSQCYSQEYTGMYM